MSPIEREDAPIRHEPARSRFVADLGDGAQAVLEYTAQDKGIRDFHRTYVPQALRGRGIAGRLVEFALDDARANGLKIKPSCPFVARFIAARPVYRSLVAAP